MGKLSFAAATPDDAAELHSRMRHLDRQEVEASSGDVAQALSRAILLSDDPVATRDSVGLVAIFGVSPITLMGDTGAIWLLGTERMRNNAAEVVRETRRYVEFVRERYPKLVGYVDARNGPSIRWLERVGFTLDPPAPHGVAGLPFHRFTMGFDDV